MTTEPTTSYINADDLARYVRDIHKLDSSIPIGGTRKANMTAIRRWLKKRGVKRGFSLKSTIVGEICLAKWEQQLMKARVEHHVIYSESPLPMDDLSMLITPGPSRTHASFLSNPSPPDYYGSTPTPIILSNSSTPSPIQPPIKPRRISPAPPPHKPTTPVPNPLSQTLTDTEPDLLSLPNTEPEQ